MQNLTSAYSFRKMLGIYDVELRQKTPVLEVTKKKRHLSGSDVLCLEDIEASLKEFSFLETNEGLMGGKIMSNFNKQVNKYLFLQMFLYPTILSKVWLFPPESEVKHSTGFIYLNLNKNEWLNILNIFVGLSWGKWFDYLTKRQHDRTVRK